MPRPARKPFEKKAAYASRLIRHYHHEGYPHAQAIAVGLRVAGVPLKRQKKPKGLGSR